MRRAGRLRMIRFFGRLALATLALTISMSGAACSSAPSSSTEEDVAVSSAAITTTDVMARAEQWVAVKLKYCQAPNGGRDYDAACSTYCSRQTNAQWDPYRSDCSGFVLLTASPSARSLARMTCVMSTTNGANVRVTRPCDGSCHAQESRLASPASIRKAVVQRWTPRA